LTARLEIEAEASWDQEPDTTGLAEAIRTAREDPSPETSEDWAPIYIPPGKEDTVQGKLAAAINAAKARVARFEAEDGWRIGQAKMTLQQI
jgi:hypothetical protein